MENSKEKKIIEALLFASSEPVSAKKIAEVIEYVDTKTVRKLIDQLCEEYDRLERSFQIVEIANGYQICTRPEYHEWIEKLYSKQISVNLSTAALETLAIVAYNQPVTRAKIEEIRGVNSSGVLNTLMQKKLIRVSGRGSSAGHPLLFSTTDEFLKHFGLKDLTELPSIDEVEDMFDEYPDNKSKQLSFQFQRKNR